MNDFAKLRRLGLLSSVSLVAMLGACGDDEKKTDATDATETSETAQETVQETVHETVEETTAETAEETTEETVQDTTPDSAGPTFATLTFSIDDSANKTFDASDLLAWKGSFKYTAATNVLEFDGAWGGPYPLLYDDGPAPGGHERDGATAGDSIWTTVVKVATPTVEQTFEYGAAYGDGGANWIWNGDGNGKVIVPAGSTAQIDAVGMAIAKHGTIDLMLGIDVSGDGANLDATFQGVAYTDVKVKGSAWGWGEIAMSDDGTKGDTTAGDGKYTFVLSENLGKHDGLLLPGVDAQFVFVLGGVEYKVAGAPSRAGVKAYTKAQGAAVWTEVTVANMPDGDKNTFVVIP